MYPFYISTDLIAKEQFFPETAKRKMKENSTAFDRSGSPFPSEADLPTNH
jgi:hypothetical protein